MNILIIEANPVFQIKLRSIVEQLGHCVSQIIGSMEEAQVCLQQPEQFGLVISDVMLKDGNIFEIKQWPDVPIIFITAMEDMDHLENSLKIKNSWFLVKPFSELSLKALIIKLLDEVAKSSNLYLTVFGKHKNPINIPVEEILFLESEGNYSTIVTREHGKYAIKRSAKQLMNDFKANFVRIRRATFVSKSKITAISLVESKVYVGNYSFKVTKEFKKNIYEYHFLNI